MNKPVLLIAGALLAASVSPLSARDSASEAFLKKAIEGNYAEIRMGELAQTGGQSDAVKAFGKMLATDHAAANQKALDAAKALGMTPPTAQNDRQASDLDTMSKMRGAKFDRVFANHMVSDHKKDIAAYKKEAKVKDAGGDYASGQLPTLQKHLDTATALKAGK